MSIKIIEVFRAGTHTDNAGNEKEWTEEDVQNIVNIYNESVESNNSFEVPIVKGHPETDAPAYGWVKKLEYDNGVMKAHVEFNKLFEEEIKDEQYKKVSIALYEDNRLRHIGMLGGVPPAVQGLKPVEFNDGDKKFRGFDFVDDSSIGNSDEPVKDSKALLLEREEKYGINRKDNIGYMEKPKAYSDIEEEDFADPVNFMFPMHDEENFIASYRAFGDWEMREKYTTIEKQVISARLLKGIKRYNIDMKDDNRLWAFSEGKKNEFVEIELKDSLKRDKPKHWSEYKDSDFADPVHYRFAVKTKTQVLSSIALVHQKNKMKEYTEHEKEIIRSRIVQAAINIGVNLNNDNWQFALVPMNTKDLTKTQLENVINNSLNNNKEFSMNEYITRLIEFIVNWIKENVSDEVGVSFKEAVDDWIKANPMEDKKPEEEKPQFSENEIKLFKEVEELKRDKRTKASEEFAESLIKQGKILPFHKDNVVNLFEALHTNDKKIEFSISADKKESLNTIDGMKHFFSSLPENKLQGNIAENGKAEVTGTDRDIVLKKALQYQEDQAKSGNLIEFDVALGEVTKNDNTGE